MAIKKQLDTDSEWHESSHLASSDDDAPPSPPYTPQKRPLHKALTPSPKKRKADVYFTSDEEFDVKTDTRQHAKKKVADKTSTAPRPYSKEEELLFIKLHDELLSATNLKAHFPNRTKSSLAEFKKRMIKQWRAMIENKSR